MGRRTARTYMAAHVVSRSHSPQGLRRCRTVESRSAAPRRIDRLAAAHAASPRARRESVLAALDCRRTVPRRHGDARPGLARDADCRLSGYTRAGTGVAGHRDGGCASADPRGCTHPWRPLSRVGGTAPGLPALARAPCAVLEDAAGAGRHSAGHRFHSLAAGATAAHLGRVTPGRRTAQARTMGPTEVR